MRSPSSSIAMAGAAFLLACGLAQAQAPACGKASCVKPDTLVSATTAGRALIAADPVVPGRLAAGLTDTARCGWDRQIVHVSADDGASWQGTCLPMPGDFFGVADESPAVAMNLQGEILAPALYDDGADTQFVGIHRSADDGATWSELEYAGGSTYFKGRVRKLHSVVDSSAKSAYRGSVYLVYTADGPQDDAIHIRLLRSTDGGHSWLGYAASLEYDSSVFVDNASLAVGRNGTLYLTYIKCRADLFSCDGKTAGVLLTVSRDGGRTWEPQGEIATLSLPAHRPMLAIDASKGPYQGSLYLVTDNRAGSRNVVTLSRSSDEGATWSAPVRVASGKATQFMPWASVNDKGQLAITWMDTRNDPEGKKFQPTLALSSDGGASFSKPVALDPDLSDSAQSWGEDLVSHAWSGGLLRAAFNGPNTDGSQGIRAGGLTR